MAKHTQSTAPRIAAEPAREASAASIARSRRIGAVVAIAGALVMIGGIFLPWLDYGDSRVTGWGLYQSDATGGGDGFLVTAAFGAQARSILFTGFTLLVADILVIMAAVWVLALARRHRLGTPRLAGQIVFPTMQIATLTLGLGIINLVMLLASEHARPVSAGPGLFVVVAGGLVAAAGMFAAVGTRRGVAAQPDRAG